MKSVPRMPIVAVCVSTRMASGFFLADQASHHARGTTQQRDDNAAVLGGGVEAELLEVEPRRGAADHHHRAVAQHNAGAAVFFGFDPVRCCHRIARLDDALAARWLEHVDSALDRLDEACVLLRRCADALCNGAAPQRRCDSENAQAMLDHIFMYSLSILSSRGAGVTPMRTKTGP